MRLFNRIRLLIGLQQEYNKLHRWCHKDVPNCNEKVIEKKIEFALSDNDIGSRQLYKLKKNDLNKKFNYQDYISYYYNI